MALYKQTGVKEIHKHMRMNIIYERSVLREKKKFVQLDKRLFLKST